MWEDELFDDIQKGDKVWYENEQGQTIACVQNPTHWAYHHGLAFAGLSLFVLIPNLVAFLYLVK